jgi:hypothetical protein
MLAAWTARATSSFPAPLSPSINTGNGEAAAFITARRTVSIAALPPTRSGIIAAAMSGDRSRSRAS